MGFLIVGDFAYKRKITDPDQVSGADSGISNLDGQRQILGAAGQHDREVWFDVHIWSEQLAPSAGLLARLRRFGPGRVMGATNREMGKPRDLFLRRALL